MILRSMLYSIACFTLLLGISGTPSSISKAQSNPFSIKKTQKKAIIFDLGGVLIKTHSLKAFQFLNIPDVFYYMVISRTSPQHSLEEKLYEVLSNIEPFDYSHPPTTDEKGIILPELFHQWLAGTKTPAMIKALAFAAIEEHPEWFEYEVQKRIVKRMITMIFTPSLFAKTRKLIDGAVEFVTECKNLGYKVYVLSNWDAESIDYVHAQYPELFDLFDGICVSGNEGCTKPDPRIYKQFLKKHKLKAHECWFIDDQKNNIAGALTCGINGMICPQKGIVSASTDFEALRYQLV